MSNRYYCPVCRSELTLTTYIAAKGNLFMCPVCVDSDGVHKIMSPIPDLEPLAEWEKRTGQECPNNMPVWVRYYSIHRKGDWILWTLGEIKVTVFSLNRKDPVKKKDWDSKGYQILIAHGSNEPDDNYPVPVPVPVPERRPKSALERWNDMIAKEEE